MMILSKKDLMTDEEFSLLRDLVEREFGVQLRGDKRLTLHARVSHRLSILGLRTYGEYYDFINSDSSKEELYELASHITNNEKFFFAERSQLDLFPGLMKDIITEKQKGSENKIRILSAASSGGEEAYTLNIIIQESGYFAGEWDIGITGIDINRHAVEKARKAIYTKASFRGLKGDSHLINKYFDVQGDNYVLRRSLTKKVEFRRGNILDADSYEGLDPVDVIFCRNALTYMSDEAVGRLAVNFSRVLSENGYLFVGSSESLIRKTNLFVPEYRHGAISYRKNTGIQSSSIGGPLLKGSESAQ